MTGEEWGDLKIANTLDAKGEFLTPSDVLDAFDDEFNFDFDPCPYPRPKWDGLRIEWGQSNYVNPPFKNESGIGWTAWFEKALEEQRKGKSSVIMKPVNASTCRAVREASKVRGIGRIQWVAIENPRKRRISMPLLLVILEGDEI